MIEDLAARYPIVRSELQREVPGLGRAVREGIAATTGTHILMMDSDGEMDPATVPELVRRLETTDCDMVVASRWARGGGVEGYDRHKYILNRGFQVLFGILFRTRIHDLTLGFKLMKSEVARRANFNSTFHEIAAETTLRPIRLGYRVEEVPTIWTRRQAGVSQNPFRRNFRYVWKALEILRA